MPQTVRISDIFYNFVSMETNKLYQIWRTSSLCAVGIMIMYSCKDKPKANEDIIAPKPAKVEKKATQRVGDYSQNRDVEWLGSKYSISMTRQADTSLPLAEDEIGNKYYDNKITITIKRSDGTEFFKRTFTKADFASCVSKQYYDTGALLGVVFNTVEGTNMYFAASVGSPDKMSDNFVPLVVKLTSTGGLTIYEDTQMDTNAGSSEEEESAESEYDGV